MTQRVYLLPMLCALSSLRGQTPAPLTTRIGHTDPGKYTRSRSHGEPL